MGCPSGGDRSFGPRVNPSCRSFDFTLQFEDIFFACLPAAMFLVLSPSRLIPLIQSHPLNGLSFRSRLLAGKLIALTSLFAVQLTFLVFRATSPVYRTNASVAADVLTLVATTTVMLVSLLDHLRSTRPSTLISLYLSTLLILGIARTRTLWLLDFSDPIPRVMTVVQVITGVVLLLESIEKRALTTHEEKPSAPEESSGFWTRTCFTWLTATFWSGYTKIIMVEDLPALDIKLESRVLGKKLISTWDNCDHRGRHSLLRICFKSYFLSFASPIIPRLCLTTFTFAQPFLINTTVSFVGQTHPDSTYGKGLIGAWALVFLGISVSDSIYTYQKFRFATRVRGGLIALVYDRTIQTRAADVGDITAITVMGTDVERIVNSMLSIHEIWGSLLDIGIASWLLGLQLSLACLAPIVLVLVFIVITSKVSVLLMTAQTRWIEKVQERLRVTTILLGEMKAVKMLGLTQVMSTVVQGLRVNEIKTSKAYRKLLVIIILLSLSPMNLAPVVTFAVYAIISLFWKNETLLAAQAFTSIALIALLTTPVIVFVQTLPNVFSSIGCFNRIQEYCNYNSYTKHDDVDSKVTKDQPGVTVSPRCSTPETNSEALQVSNRQVISFEGENFHWDKKSSPALHDLKLKIGQGEVTAIVGPVGSGKTAFLNSILGEMIATSGSSTQLLKKHWQAGSMAYCSQEPWLENGTVRQNIVGTDPCDDQWYNAVKFACGLVPDIQQLRNKDDERIGSKGLSLSGGQKQRVALARAVYARRTIVVLDDTFSGMDAHTAKLVSSRLLGSDGIFRKHHTTVILASNSRKIISLADSIIVLQDGKVAECGTPSVLLRSDGYISTLGITDAAKKNVDKMVPDLLKEPSDQSSDIAEENNNILTDMRRKNADMSVYKYYLANAGYLAVTLYVITVIVWIFCTEFSTIWIKWWSAANAKNPNKSIGFYMGVYTMLGVMGTFGASMAAWFAFVSIISNTAISLHSDLLEATVRAPFRFFAVTDNGELLNRFSEDMQLIDMDLPSALINYTSTAGSLMAKIIILAVFSQYLGASIPLIGIALYFIQRFYLQTSRQVRLLGIEARAPLYTHFTESVAGAATIRAFGWQADYRERNYRHIDRSQRPTYLQHCIQAWLSFVLNLMATLLAILVVGTVVTWHDSFNAGSVGVSLIMVITFSETTSRLIRSWTLLESRIGAVKRIKQFKAETESEEATNMTVPVSADWPQKGALEFDRVIASYGPNSTPVLKNVSMSIRSGEHIAICGRSGSGKTSLILCLLQMIEMQKGQITLDGVDIATMRKTDLRSRINVVPQDPFLIPGTIRFNIDPSGNVSDNEINTALNRVGLLTIVQDEGGLDKELNSTTWSAGQKQLLCLARAMVKKCRILVLDEAMSSVDSQTEDVMQGIIDSEYFRDCTVLAVMHRLKHATCYDKVLLMGNGKLLEFDEPGSLLSGDTLFADLHRLDRN